MPIVGWPIVLSTDPGGYLLWFSLLPARGAPCLPTRVLSAFIFLMAHIHCLPRVMVINIHCRLMGVVINIHCRYQSPLRPRRFQPQSPQSQYSTKATPASHTRLAD